MASNRAFVRVMVVLAMLVLLATPSSASISSCIKDCQSDCHEGKITCAVTCIPTCFVTGGNDVIRSECKRSCFLSECIKFVDDEKKAIECMKSCDNSCENKI